MATTAIFRIPCPHCGRVLKIPLAWAGRKGVCPACAKAIEFPKALATEVVSSKLGEAILGLLCEHDEPMDERAMDHLTMLLGQGTCRDYRAAQGTLGDRKMSARQWRRALSGAAAQEMMRLHAESQVNRLTGLEEDSMPLLAVIESPAVQDSWQIMARFAYFTRHEMCAGCKGDPTGLHCIYRAYPEFVRARNIGAERSERWEKVCRHLLGV